MDRWQRLNQPVGCGLWLVGLLMALFAGEWLLLWAVIQWLPLTHLPMAVLVVALVTFVVGSAVVILRLRRRTR